MTNPFKPEKSDKKSSWKSLAGNLFGIEFDDQNSLDDLDLDSVADAVEELNSPQEHHDHDCARDHDHDSDEFDFDFEAPEVADSPSLAKPQQPAAPTSEKSASASSKKEKSAQTTTPSKSSDRSLYEDEDLFGFGIMVDSLNEDTEDFEDDEDDSDDSSAELSAFVEPEDQEPISEVSQASEKSEPSLEEFDFDFDFEEDDEPAPAQKPQRERQTPKQLPPLLHRLQKMQNLLLQTNPKLLLRKMISGLLWKNGTGLKIRATNPLAKNLVADDGNRNSTRTWNSNSKRLLQKNLPRLQKR